MAYPIEPPHGLAGCYGTERDGTERKSYQDTGENPSVPDARTPVDNRYPSLDPEWEAAFLGCEQERLSTTEIAVRFGVSTRTVTRWRTALNRNRKPAAVRRPESDHVLAKRLLDDGCSLAEVGRTVGVAPTTIHAWFPGVQGWTRVQSGEYAAMVRLGGMAA
ncbi:helix-turn-helix domain-containing protein [Microbacterium sp. 22195]|uniref:helix-turn-helix domain-containing protein n=1 Tax=Microbacterium sp. 22195 TaxID=3453891 RepID=UPI003F873B67